MKFLDPNYQEISLYCKTDTRHFQTMFYTDTEDLKYIII